MGCLGGGPGGSAVCWERSPACAPVPRTPCCRRPLSHQVLPGPGVCGAESADQPPCLQDTPTTSVHRGCRSCCFINSLNWAGVAQRLQPPTRWPPEPLSRAWDGAWSESWLDWPLGAPPRADRGQAGWAGSRAASVAQRQACAKAPSDLGAQGGYLCVCVCVCAHMHVSVQMCPCVSVHLCIHDSSLCVSAHVNM